MLKPDAVQRNLVGEVIARFERAGLKLIALKMLNAPLDICEKHYPAEPELLKRFGENTIRGFAELGKDVKAEFGTEDAAELGKMVRGWLMDSITSSPVVAMVWEGNHAIKSIRKIVGSTIPGEAPAGTIRGDYSTDTPDVANAEHRSLFNLVHASGNPEEAKFEVGLWFPELNK